MFRIKPPTVMVLAVILVILLQRYFPGTQLWTAPQTYGGVLPIVIGLGLLFVSLRGFHRQGTTSDPFDESKHLVTAGPYEYSRNPMYLGMLLSLVGCVILTGRVTPWLVPPLFAVILHHCFIKPEETRLANRFGPVYSDYLKRVRRWI
jgi:protein-S-isoprenylcysteine O-methyltransferase Ste14